MKKSRETYYKGNGRKMQMKRASGYLLMGILSALGSCHIEIYFLKMDSVPVYAPLAYFPGKHSSCER